MTPDIRRNYNNTVAVVGYCQDSSQTLLGHLDTKMEETDTFVVDNINKLAQNMSGELRNAEEAAKGGCCNINDVQLYFLQ